MDSSSLKDSPVLSSPFSFPNVSALLKIKIISWIQETGLPVSTRVQVADRTFNLHKKPLLSKSGYFKRKLSESNETFEMIALFIYGSSTLVDPFNVAALRCAADFLEIKEEHGSGNLCERFDIYLNQVVLQSWDDTLIVLQKCQTLLPWSEELLIVSRCIESLAFMACMEILDPERRRDRPVITLKALASQAWNSETVNEVLSHDLWIKDLIALPFGFFKRIIGSLRRQGMRERYVSPIIVFYANKWILSKKTRQFWENSGYTKNKVSVILEGILDLLPMRDKAGKTIPVGFYFSLLSKSLEFGFLKNESMTKLKDQIASVLHLAQVEDLLLPRKDLESISSSIEVATMKDIFLTFVSSNRDPNHTPPPSASIVAELWDLYLSHIGPDPNLEPKSFMDLIETIPISSRQSHDNLYRALNTYLQAHPGMSQDDKGMVCKYLSCQKLSQEVCIEAVQNELMPLRLIVQALFVQQLNTHQAFKECSDSFRYAQLGDFSSSLSSSRHANSKSQNLSDSPYIDGGEQVSRPLSLPLPKDIATQRPEFTRKDYESTSFRIQNLEQELMSLKRSLQLQNICINTEPVSKKSQMVPANSQSLRLYGLEGRTLSRKRNPLGQVSACIGSVNFASHRKYASRLLKVFRRLSLFGRGKSKRKPGSTAPWP
ncbi:hypothetical protein NMG60_11035320 [Bertholletia excelsa]